MQLFRFFLFSFIFIIFLFGCQNSNTEKKGNATHFQKTDLQNSSEIKWIELISALEEEYKKKGISSFLEAKEKFAQSAKLYHEDPFFLDVAYFFINPDSWSWKESMTLDAIEFQKLIKKIESNPGKSINTWKLLKHKTYFLYSGSSNPHPSKIALEILKLYKIIAQSPNDKKIK